MIATEVRKPYKKDGIWNYPELPAGMREATIANFEILTGEVVFGINILYKPGIDMDYQAHNIHNKSVLQNWKKYIDAGKVYIDKIPYKATLAPSVARNGWILKTETTKPLMAEKNAETAMAINNGTMSGSSCNSG